MLSHALLLIAVIQNPPGSDRPIRVPVTIAQKNANGGLKPKIVIGVGDLPLHGYGFDTGSSGLHVWAVADLRAPGSGVECSDTTTTVTYGNPPRITFYGVICHARLRLGAYLTPQTVRIAYLDSASCLGTGCHVPNLKDSIAMGGFGVFGVGISGAMDIPNPILTLPAPYNTYSVRLRRKGGVLVLGSKEPPTAATFHMTPASTPGVWTYAKGCLFVDSQSINTCLNLSFDTGNPVPWIHNVNDTTIQQPPGIVRVGTRIGFAPLGDSTEAISVVAGNKANLNQIRMVSVPREAPISNTGIAVFFNHIVTYDYQAGTISFAPWNSPRGR